MGVGDQEGRGVSSGEKGEGNVMKLGDEREERVSWSGGEMG